MIERNGGRIWAVSLAGQGSRFHVALPATATGASSADTRDTAAAA